MPKRKRSVEDTIHSKLEKYRIDIFRAISSAKAAERKRFGARLREPGVTTQKKARLEREHDCLKALDLRQVARHHLHSNLLRIKAVEASSHLPSEIRDEEPKSTLSPEDITIHNNVVSQLCNTPTARQALDRAVADICETLGVPVAEKSKKARKNKRRDPEDQPSDRIASPGSTTGEEDDADNEEEPPEATTRAKAAKQTTKSAPAVQQDGDNNNNNNDNDNDDDDGGSEFRGFSSGDEDDDDDAEKAQQRLRKFEGLDESDEEGAISKYDNLLGASSDDEDDEFDEQFLAKYRGREQVNLDDISLSGSAYGSDSEDEDDAEADARSASGSPPPKKSKSTTKTNGDKSKDSKKTTKAQDKEFKEASKAKKATKAAVKASKTGSSAFLPTLMGGYISGSESASDIDAPPKKSRRGQRARQAIWEKKYGANAKHLQKAASKGGRDAGWDMKRGAVEAGDRSKGKWGKGAKAGGGGGGGRGQSARNNGHATGREAVERSRPAPKPTKKDDEGPLHPSWAARKKAKEAEKSIAFTGTKVVFD